MNAAGKVALGVASGYILGRRRKFKLAITVGSMLAGQRIATNPRGLLQQAQQLVDSNEELSRLQDQVREQLFEAARAAAMATAAARMDRLSDTIRDRSQLLALGPAEDSDEEAEEAEDEADEQPVDEADTDQDEADTDQDESGEYEDEEASDSKKSRPTSTAKKAVKKTAPAKKAAKKAPVKKSSSSSRKRTSSTSSSSSKG